MPPKRQSPNSQQSGNAPKKSKTDANGTPALPEIPRSKRWSKVSATANADMEFKMMTRDPAMAYSWVCLCKKRFQRFEEDADDEDEEGGEAEKGDDVCSRRTSITVYSADTTNREKTLRATGARPVLA